NIFSVILIKLDISSRLKQTNLNYVTMKSIKATLLFFSYNYLLISIKSEPNSPSLKLYNVYEMPMLGLGTGLTFGEETYQAVTNAIDVGYRHFDTAYLFFNEEGV